MSVFYSTVIIQVVHKNHFYSCLFRDTFKYFVTLVILFQFVFLLFNIIVKALCVHIQDS